MKRKLEVMPSDKSFWNRNGQWELCRATGYEVYIGGEWRNEYTDSEGYSHFGR